MMRSILESTPVLETRMIRRKRRQRNLGGRVDAALVRPPEKVHGSERVVMVFSAVFELLGHYQTRGIAF